MNLEGDMSTDVSASSRSFSDKVPAHSPHASTSEKIASQSAGAYSDLEVSRPRPPRDQEGLQAAYFPPRHNASAIELPDRHGPSPSPYYEEKERLQNASKSPLWVRRRRNLVISTCVLALVVLGAILGGVFASRSSPRKSSGSSSSSPSNSAPSSSSTSSSSSPSLSPSLATAAKSVQTGSSIAAISLITDGITQYRLYFQDEKNNIRESSWNSTGQKWYVSNPSVAVAKERSPLAAGSVKPTDFSNNKGEGSAGLSGPQINLFYLNEANHIQEILSTDGDAWVQGTVSGQSIAVSDDSRLAMVWHARAGCNACPNSRILVYQAKNGGLGVINGTQDADTQQRYNLNTTALEGTGLALTLQWQDDFIPGIRLFYQTEDGHAVSYDWESPAQWEAANVSSWADGKPDDNGWQNREEWPIDPVPLHSEFGAWTSSTTLPDTLPALVQTFCSGPDGVEVIGWVGKSGGAWLPLNRPSILNDIRPSSKIDANGDGRVYAIANNGTIQEFWVKDDGQTWHTGNEVITG